MTRISSMFGKTTTAVATLALALAMGVGMTGCGEPSAPAPSTDAAQQQASQPATDGVQQEAQVKVSVIIDASAAEVEVKTQDVSLDEGATAYDALVATGSALGGDPSYVTSIDGVAAGDLGAESGWMYYVNDVMPDVAANDYVLADGDAVKFIYVKSWMDLFPTEDADGASADDADAAEDGADDDAAGATAEKATTSEAGTAMDEGATSGSAGSTSNQGA